MLEQMLGRSGMEQWISSSTTAVRPEVRDHYEETLRETQVDLSAELGRTVLPVTELARLQEGDVIPLDRKTDDPIRVFVNDEPKFEAVPGRSGQKRALRITSVESIEDVDFDSLSPSPDHDPEHAYDAHTDGTDGAGDAAGAAASGGASAAAGASSGAGAGFPVAVTADTPKSIGEALKGAAATTLMNFASRWIDKLAYDAAVAVSDAAAGKETAVYEKPPGEYIVDTASKASASAINEVMKNKVGFGICEIPNVDFKMKLKLGLTDIYGEKPPESECGWTDVADEWTLDNFKERNPSLNPENMDENFLDSFRKNTGIDKSGLGVSLKSSARVGEKEILASQKADAERKINEGFEPIRDSITNAIQTPSELVQKEAEATTQKEKSESKQDALGSSIASGSLSVIVGGIGVFVSTLASKLLDQLLNPQSGGLTGADVGIGGETRSAATQQYSGPAVDSRRAAEKAFGFLQANTVKTKISELNIITKFSSCPTEDQVRSKNNCVIDQGMAQAIRQADAGDPLTIQEALEQNIIADKPLVPPDHPRDKERNCYTNGYCYSNIKRLRKFRILPLGFEIAAKKADPDELSWTLSKVINNFEDCNANGERDADHPYCHLIDPNWIIKSPQNRCLGSQEPGPILKRAKSAERKNICTNIQTCVKNEGPNKDCQAWGYCTQEEKDWELPGESCDPQWNTCTTYFDNNNQAKSYLARTLDFGSCDTGNVGCRAYALEKKNGDWVSSVETISTSISGDKNLKIEEGRNKIINFDDDITDRTCTEDSWGCSEFFVGNLADTSTIEKTNETVHLKQAPSYLNCYDSNPNTAETDRPQTRAQARLTHNNSQQCENFSAACVQEEVGCKSWTPISQPGDELPAKIGNNSCPTACVGYGTLRQKETVFTPEVNQLSFIPSDGRSCSASFEGCSEFTNLSEAAEGGERLEYYTDLQSCEEPTEDNQKTFYTWSGQEGQGFELQRHQLAVYVDDDPGVTNDEDDFDYLSSLLNSPPTSSIITTGSPKYNSFNQEQLQDFYSRCNEESYKTLIQNPRDPDAADPACRAYIDDNGNTYYRLSNRLRVVSDQCHKLRKTETNLAESEDISSSGTCDDRGGAWGDIDEDNSDECGICRGGGTYQNGDCIYKTVSTPDSPNSCRGPGNNPDRFNGCRAYEGTTAGDVATVFEDNFEPLSNTSSALRDARAGWKASQNTSLQTVAAALQTQMHSLKVSFSNQGDDAERVIESNTLTQSTEEMDTKTKYELSFWARGDSQAIDITLEQQQPQNTDTTTVNPVSISGSWRKYTVGPTSFTGDPSATTTIRFETQNSPQQNTNDLFIDNVKLTEREGAIYLVKDSWKRTVTYRGQEVEADVPLVCDSSPTDTIAGSQLGCTLYEDSLGNQQAATEFKQLCRPNAVGCKPMFETHNSDSEQEQWFKVKASTSTRGGLATITSTILASPNNTTTVLGSCQTKPEEKTCFVDEITIPENIDPSSYSDLQTDNLVTSTMVVPADAASSSPIFITDQEEYRCDESKQGCIKTSKQKQSLPNDSATSSYEFESSEFLVDDPEDYITDEEQGSGTLCSSNLVGCKRFTKQNETVFFKDPTITGEKFCRYKEGVAVTLNGSQRPTEASGWFKEGVGVCEYDSNKTNASTLNSNARECRNDNGCTVQSGGSTVTGTCKYKGTLPCYPNSRGVDNNFRVWSNEVGPRYEGFVGKCPAEENMCREFIDRANDSWKNPNGKPHYRIFDRQMKQEVLGQCNGQVGLKEGCALFDKTDDPSKKYNTKESYQKSREESRQGEKYTKVDPVTKDTQDPGEIDANMIMKVDRTRQCSQWWSCSNKKVVYTEGEANTVCTDFKMCNEANESGECINYVNLGGSGYCAENPEKVCLNNSECPQSECIFPEPLTSQNYVNRDTSFYGPDYSGHAIPNLQNVNNFITLSFTDLTEDNLTKYMAYRMPQEDFRVDVNVSAGRPYGRFFDRSCLELTDGEDTDQKGDDELAPKDNWTKCGFTTDPGGQGRCWKGMCIKPIKTNRQFPADLNSTTFEGDINTSSLFRKKVGSALTGASCKVYPESTAPFRQTVLEDQGENLDRNQLGAADPANREGETARYDFTQFGGEESGDKYTNANVCQNGNCSCMYRKIRYEGGVTDYWKFNTRMTDYDPGSKNMVGERFPGICRSSNDFWDGQFCTNDFECGIGGDCLNIERAQRQIGTYGYCLERDNAISINGGAENLCLTWFPSQISATTFSLNNRDLRAGYYPPEDSNNIGGKAYCTAARKYDELGKQSTFTDGTVHNQDILDLEPEGTGNTDNNHGLYDVWNAFRDDGLLKQSWDLGRKEFDFDNQSDREELRNFVSVAGSPKQKNVRCQINLQVNEDGRNSSVEDALETIKCILNNGEEVYGYNRFIGPYGGSKIKTGAIEAVGKGLVGFILGGPAGAGAGVAQAFISTGDIVNGVFCPQMKNETTGGNDKCVTGTLDGPVDNIKLLERNKNLTCGDLGIHEDDFKGKGDQHDNYQIDWTVRHQRYRLNSTGIDLASSTYDGVNSAGPAYREATEEVNSTREEFSNLLKGCTTEFSSLNMESSTYRGCLIELTKHNTDSPFDLWRPTGVGSDECSPLAFTTDVNDLFTLPQANCTTDTNTLESNYRELDKAYNNQAIFGRIKRWDHWTEPIQDHWEQYMYNRTGKYIRVACGRKYFENLPYFNWHALDTNYNYEDNTDSDVDTGPSDGPGFPSVMREWGYRNINENDDVNNAELLRMGKTGNDSTWGFYPKENDGNLTYKDKPENTLEIRDAWLENIYIVPTRIEGGEPAEGFVPATLSRDYVIPINNLICAKDGSCDQVEEVEGISEFINTGEVNIKRNDDGEVISREYSKGNAFPGMKPEDKKLNTALNMYPKDNANLFSYVKSVGPQNDTSTIRYVSIFYNPDKPPNFFQNRSGGGPIEANVFERCRGGTEPNGSWMAVGMEFFASGEREGEFKRYRFNFCNRHPASDHKVHYAIFGTMQRQCKEFASVYNPQNLFTSKATNKAKTNHVWNQQTSADKSAPEAVRTNGDPPVRSTLNPPFGTIALQHEQIEESGGSNEPTLQNYTMPLESPSFGFPYREGSNKNITRRTGDVGSRWIMDNLFRKVFSYRNIWPNATQKSDTALGQTAYDNTYGKRDISGESGNPPKIYSLNPMTCGQNTRGGQEIDTDCVPAESNNITVNGKTGLARDYDGHLNIPAQPGEEFAGSQGNWEGITGLRSLKADVKFFAMAHRDQMPIRRVKVKWGDEDVVNMDDNWGYYKNRKPFCGNEEGLDVNRCAAQVTDPPNSPPSPPSSPQPPWITCSPEGTQESDRICSFVEQDDSAECKPIEKDSDISDVDNTFANTSRACREGHFEYQHTYTCSPADLDQFGQTVNQAVKVPSGLSPSSSEAADPDGDGIYNGWLQELKNKGLSESDEVCVYRPAVQVLDNWGWCNGDCGPHQASDGSFVNHPNGGCYNAPGDMQCNERTKTIGINNTAWTKFQGKIIVIPRRQF